MRVRRAKGVFCISWRQEAQLEYKARRCYEVCVMAESHPVGLILQTPQLAAEIQATPQDEGRWSRVR